MGIFQGLCPLDEDPVSGPHPRANHDGRGCGQTQRAGTGCSRRGTWDTCTQIPDNVRSEPIGIISRENLNILYVSKNKSEFNQRKKFKDEKKGTIAVVDQLNEKE